MICPGCRLESDLVEKTMDHRVFVTRHRRCGGCRGRWSTQEFLIKGSFVASDTPNPDEEGGEQKGARLASAGQPPAKGEDIDSGSDLFPTADPDPYSSVLAASGSGARTRVSGRRKRGRNKPTSIAFEACWKLYGRKEDKAEAFEVWLLVADGFEGGEQALGAVIESALKWQTPNWEKEGFKYTPYFCRYLRRRKWEDGPRPVGQTMPARTQNIVDVVGGWLTDKRNGGTR